MKKWNRQYIMMELKVWFALIVLIVSNTLLLGQAEQDLVENSLNTTMIQYEWQVNKIACTGDSARGRLIYENGTPPMRIVLKKDDSFKAYIDTLYETKTIWDVPNSLESGSYTLFMTDAASDTVRYNFIIDEPEALDIIILYKESISCNDTDGALVHLLPKGIQEGEDHTLKWSSGQTTEIVEGLTPGVYQVTLTNSLGCTKNIAFEVDGIPPIEIEVAEIIAPTCPDVADGSISVDVRGGVGIQYFYEWNDPNLPKKWYANELLGGDYYLTVFDISGCENSINIPLDIPPPIEPNIQAQIPSCAGFTDGSIVLEANENGALPFVYSLNGGIPKGQSEYLDLPSGIYDFLITDSRDCSLQKSILLEDPEEPKIDLGEDRTLLIGESIPLVNNTASNASYQFDWFPKEFLDCFDCPRPIATPLNTTTYSVIVTDEMGCYKEEEVTLNVRLDRPVFFPTAFSPNGDGNNDFFEIQPGKTTSEIIRLQVFNRWGQLLFDSKINSAQGVKWDGTFEQRPVNEGVYIFAAEILFLDGQVLPYHGDVLLVR